MSTDDPGHVDTSRTDHDDHGQEDGVDTSMTSDQVHAEGNRVPAPAVDPNHYDDVTLIETSYKVRHHDEDHDQVDLDQSTSAPDHVRHAHDDNHHDHDSNGDDDNVKVHSHDVTGTTQHPNLHASYLSSSTPRTTDTCHPSGEAPAARRGNAGCNLGGLSC